MAKYTISLAEWIQEHMTDQQSMENLDDILAVSKQTVFEGPPTHALNLLSEEYKDPFILGFTSHFLFDEIGMDTPLAFKLVLASHILDNAEYIDEVFENLDKQIWSEYEVRKLDNATTDKGTVADAETVTHGGTITDSGTDTHDGTITDVRDLNTDFTHEQTQTTEDDGTITDVRDFDTDFRHGQSLTSEDDGTITDDGSISYVGKVKNDNKRHYTAEDANGDPVTPKIVRNYSEKDGTGQMAYDESVKSGSFTATSTQSGTMTDETTDSGSELIAERDGSGDPAYVKRTPTGTRSQANVHTGGMVHVYSDHATDATAALSVTPQSGVDASKLMGTTVTPTGAGQPGPGSTNAPNQGSSTKYLTQVNQQWNNDRQHSDWEKPIDVGGDVNTMTESFNQFEDKQETHYNKEQEHSFTDRQRTTERSFDNYQNVTGNVYNNLTDKVTHHYNKENSEETVYDNNFAEHADGTTEFEGRADNRDNVRTLDTVRTIRDDVTDHTDDTGSNTKTLDTTKTIRDDVTDHTDETGSNTRTLDTEDGHSNTKTLDTTDLKSATETRNLNGTSLTNEDKYRFNYEMFYKAEPYLKKIWSLFDDCFMLLIDDMF